MQPSPLDTHSGVLIYTDGSAYHKDRSGGWAFVALDAHEGYYEASGSASDTTISVMELTGPIEALNWLWGAYGACDVLILSDSEYVVKGFMDKNRARNKNKKVWRRLELAAAQHTFVQFEHVRGHAGHEFNERCDVLAGEARKRNT